MSESSTKERAKFWREPDLENLEILHAAYRRHAFKLHTHDAFATSVIDRGAGSFWYRGATHVAPAGSLVMLNPGEAHTGEVMSDEGWFYRVLYPYPTLLERITSETAGGSEEGYVFPHFPEPVVRDAQLAAAMNRLHHTLESPAPSIERESWLLWTYVSLISRHAEYSLRWAPARREPRAVARSREYIETCYDQNVSLEDLSAVAGLSRFHLIRVFRRAVGLPPHAYLNQVRVKHAKALLTVGFPIAAVAQETGFVDQSHLTRRFKGVLGITPGQFVHGLARQ